MAKPKKKTFSIYLLKENFHAGNSLKKGYEKKRIFKVEAKKLPDQATLYVLDAKPTQPWWKAHFGIGMSLEQVQKGALVFLPAGGRFFVLCFGHSYHHLKDNAYEYDFGLMVTLNSVDPKRVKDIYTIFPVSSQRRQTQIPTASSLTYFDFDSNSAIMKSMAGMVKKDYEHLFERATGTSSLRISISRTPDELTDLCEQLLGMYHSKEYNDTFPDVHNISPVKDPDIIRELETKLVEAITTQESERLYLAAPALVDYSGVSHAKFYGLGASKQYEEVYIKDYYEYIKSKKRDVRNLSIEDIDGHKLSLFYDDNSRKDHSILKCLVFDTEIDGDTFHFIDGKWYRVAADYVEKLNQDLDSYYKDIELPDYSHKSEGDYNQRAVQNRDGFLCLDRKNIAPANQSEIEPCDIIHFGEGDKVCFYHIKRSTFSQKLSHLFNQGANAVRILKVNSESMNKLKKLVGKSSTTTSTYQEFLDKKNYEVIFGIITHKDKGKKCENLPLFSRISLMRSIQDLRSMDTSVSYGFISNRHQTQKRTT